MEKISIEVPSFVGFECVGWVQPAVGLFAPYFSECLGIYKLMPARADYIKQICYRQIGKDNS